MNDDFLRCGGSLRAMGGSVRTARGVRSEAVTQRVEAEVWAQIIKSRLKPGKEEAVAGLLDQLRATEQRDSGLLRTTAMRDQDDPSIFYLMVVFENEEQARAREQDPRREEGLKAARATMAEILDGPPEFINLSVLEDNIRS